MSTPHPQMTPDDLSPSIEQQVQYRPLNQIVDTLEVGDEWSIIGSDGSWYVMRMLAEGEKMVPGCVYRRPVTAIPPIIAPEGDKLRTFCKVHKLPIPPPQVVEHMNRRTIHGPHTAGDPAQVIAALQQGIQAMRKDRDWWRGTAWASYVAWLIALAAALYLHR